MPNFNQTLGIEGISRSKHLIEKWNSRIKALESATHTRNSVERNAVLASALDITNRQRKFHESIQTPDAGIYKIFALDINKMVSLT